MSDHMPHPAELNTAPLLVVAATQAELQAALAFAGAEKLEFGQGCCVHVASGIVGLVTGIGIINAASSLGAAMATGDYLGVVNIGLGAALAPSLLPVGACCIATHEFWPDFGLAGNNRVDPMGLGLALAHTGTGCIYNSLGFSPQREAPALGLDVNEFFRARCVTVSALCGTAKRAAALHDRYDAHVESMEGFACALEAVKADVPFVEVRYLSHVAGARLHADALQAALTGLVQMGGRLFGGAVPDAHTGESS